MALAMNMMLRRGSVLRLSTATHVRGKGSEAPAGVATESAEVTLAKAELKLTFARTEATLRAELAKEKEVAAETEKAELAKEKEVANLMAAAAAEKVRLVEELEAIKLDSTNVTNRAYVERLFQHGSAILLCSSLPFDAERKQLKQGKMTSINELLHKYWDNVGPELFPSCKCMQNFPTIPNAFLYGRLSEWVHHTLRPVIYVTEEENDNLWFYLAERFGARVIRVNSVVAKAGMAANPAGT